MSFCWVKSPAAYIAAIWTEFLIYGLQAVSNRFQLTTSEYRYMIYMHIQITIYTHTHIYVYYNIWTYNQRPHVFHQVLGTYGMLMN